MKENVLVAGCNGYIGNALVQRLLCEGYNVCGIDNDIKFKWAKTVSSHSIIPILPVLEKKKIFKKHFPGEFHYFRLDIVKDSDDLADALAILKFDTVINLAQQPSAAYSHLSLKTAIETMNNNSNGTLNMLWYLSLVSPDTHYIEIESMGTIQPDIGIDIPEGYFYPDKIILDHHNEAVDCFRANKSLFPKRPGSLYHTSKVTNTYLVDCANRWWNIPITAINQGVVYGNSTPEICSSKVHSPLWIDECFGTVVNRFIAQTLLKTPLTIYGRGFQKRGYLGLNDSIQAIMLLIKNRPDNKEVRFVNQLDEVFSINQIASHFKNDQDFIDSPRVENTGDFYYNPITNTLEDLGFKKSTDISSEIEFSMRHIDIKRLNKAKHLVMPKIKWRH
jgi:UDP-sulfoquinovose synthase